MDKTTIFIAVCFGVYGLAQLCMHVILPMFNAYLEYKLNLKQMEDIPNEPIPQLYRKEKNEERLQRNNDDSDIKQRSGKSDEGTSLHDEELSL